MIIITNICYSTNTFCNIFVIYPITNAEMHYLME